MAREPKVLIRLHPSPFKRAFSVLCTGVFGLFLIYLAASLPPVSATWRLMLAAIGLGAAWFGWRIWLATSRAVVLREDGLFDSEGTPLAPVELLTRTDRGVFAFKPANGFVLTLREPMPSGWAPGLWWRIGRRVGIGGTLPGGGARAMSDAVSALLQDRD